MDKISSEITVFTDGGSRGNPGPSAIGAVISKETIVLTEISESIGITTNNVAEYKAVIAAYGWISENREKIGEISGIHFFLDSLLICSQLKGLYKIKHPQLVGLYEEAKRYEAQIKIRVVYTHIPRESNKHADRLVNKALDNLVG